MVSTFHDFAKNVKSPAFYTPGLIFYQLVGNYTYLLSVFPKPAEFHSSVNQGKKSVIFANPYILTGMDLCAPLSHKNVPGQYKLPVASLDTEPFRRTVTAVP
jgi:hypothetical protein